MKIPAVQLSFRAGLVEIPTHGVALRRYGLTTVDLPSWMQGDTLGKSEMMIFSKSLMKPSTNLCSQFNISKLTLFSIWQMTISSKWYINYRFEMRICTCVIKPFGSLQVVIRFSEWQAAGSRIRQAQIYESRCRSCRFDMIYDCLFEMIYDFHFESRAVSIGR